MEIDYLDELFDVVYRRFLNAKDHIEYHPTLQDSPLQRPEANVLHVFLKQVHIVHSAAA